MLPRDEPTIVYEFSTAKGGMWHIHTHNIMTNIIRFFTSFKKKINQKQELKSRRSWSLVEVDHKSRIRIVVIIPKCVLDSINTCPINSMHWAWYLNLTLINYFQFARFFFNLFLFRTPLLSLQRITALAQLQQK